MTPTDRSTRARSVMPGLLLLIAAAISPSGALAYDITRTAVSGGAVATASGSYAIQGTVGEVGVIGQTNGSAYAMGQGFWAGHYRTIATGAPDLGGSESVIAYVNGLQQSFPNPFHRTASIAYTVGQPSPVRLAVYDVSGRHVATLTDMNHDPGLYRMDWEGRDGSGNRVASGVYFYRLDIGSWSSTRKLLKLQ